MTLTEFINRCDLAGGLAQGFESGIIPQYIDLTADKNMRKVIYEAYEGWLKFTESKDKYYSLVESGEF